MKTILGQMKFDSDMDYDDLGKMFSLASGFRVWCERSGNIVNVLTDGDKEEVAKKIMDKASSVIEDVLFEAVAFELSGMREWEKNALLN